MAQVDLNIRFMEFQEKGYTVFEGLYDKETMAVWKRKHTQLQEEAMNNSELPWWFGNMCEFAPKLMMPAVSHPQILDFLELVTGPFIQLDNLTLAGFPSISKEMAANKTSGWHRDRWAHVPKSEAFERPLSLNAICYLQDLTDDYGPLRVIPGSHRKGILIAKEELTVPHAEELILHMKAGDVVLTHSGLLHSGTPNTSGNVRYFFSVYYNLTWLKHTDNHQGPNVQNIIKEARTRNDHRTLRLFGVDSHLESRVNSGFTVPDEIRWAEWAAADKAAIIL